MMQSTIVMTRFVVSSERVLPTLVSEFSALNEWDGQTTHKKGLILFELIV
jgi:hypothetical protein